MNQHRSKINPLAQLGAKKPVFPQALNKVGFGWGPFMQVKRMVSSKYAAVYGFYGIFGPFWSLPIL